METPHAPFSLDRGEAALVHFSDLLNAKLKIPDFQRPYDWRAEPQVKELQGDLAKSEERAPLFLGLVVLAKEDDGTYLIVDGQQRITSLLLFFAANGERIRLPQIREDDQDFFRRIIEDTSFRGRAQPQTLSQHLLLEALKKLSNATDDEIRAARRATCIAYVSPKLEGATSLFERINMRGRKVSQFDLVKNRLIGWTGNLPPDDAKGVLQTITSVYSDLYRLLNPSTASSTSKLDELDVDRLLRVHWILFTTSGFNSADRVIEAIESERARIAVDGLALATYIRRYVDTLLEVARVWVQIFNPVRLPADADDEMRKALYEFNRLSRVSELDPLLASVMLRFGVGLDSARFVRLCTIAAFRDALSKRRSNRGRSPKWTMARLLYQGKLSDAAGAQIHSIPALAHHFYWKTMSFWDTDESKRLRNSEYEVAESDCASGALDSSAFYQEFGNVLHYFFWEYGLMLRTKTRPELYGWEPTQGDIFLNESYWLKFRSHWDIEHVFPVKPDYQAATAERLVTKLKTHEKMMRPFLNHLGNLTIVPRSENRGLLSNSDFTKKRDEMIRRDEVLFNKLFRDTGYTGNQMTKPFWGPNNCKRRRDHLVVFADIRWGTEAVRKLGVSSYDARVDFEATVTDEDENGVEDEAALVHER